MFTGIVEEVGVVVGAGPGLTVACGRTAEDAEVGDSIAVSGVCLTVAQRTVAAHGATLAFDLSEETLRRTALGTLGHGDRVNLERPATLLTRLGGHLVQGHVDGVGRISTVMDVPGGREMRVDLPEGVRRYVVEKGSIAVDGVSLTVTDVDGESFGVALIPHTLEATTFGDAQVGDPVNIEVDVVAKYVESLMRERT